MMEDKNDLAELPRGWVWTKLMETCEIILGQSPPSSTYNENGNGLPFYQGKLEFGDIYPTPRKWCTSPKKIAEKGDVFISVRAPVGPTNICPGKSCIGRGLAAIRGLSGIEPFFILYLMRAFENIIAEKGTGTTFKAITGNQLKGIPIPLPPLPEQHRIVAKIEELFTRMDSGVEALKKVKAELKRYRQAVLKAAMEGKLTGEWREEHKGKLEPASVLLERIKEERKKKLGKKYKELPSVDTEDLGELPEGWVWARVGNLTDVIVGYVGPISKDYTHKSKGMTLLSTTNISDNGLKIDNLKYVTPEFHNKNKKSQVFSGDILVARHGISGLTSLVPEWISEAHALNVVIIRKSSSSISDYLTYLFNSENTLARLTKSKTGSVQRIVNTNVIKILPIPLPPLPEQHKIVEEIERRFSVADAAEKAVEQSLRQAGRLRQSILKKAFEGKLVPQDPEDEPAEKLLERIKEEKARRGSEKKAKKRVRV